jgi:aryl-alcohol dehydrogenase-like predicted oxidoreductase
LTGKYRKGTPPTGKRANHVQRFRDDPKAVARLETLLAVAKEHDVTPAQVALAWQLHKRFVTTPIASATSPAQLRELVTQPSTSD